MMTLRWACASLTALALATSSPAQVVSRIIPNASAPGDLLIVEGSGFSQILFHGFYAFIGGFAGLQIVPGTILSMTDTRILMLAPGPLAFAPPNASPSSSPHGALEVAFLQGSPSRVGFFFMEGTFQKNSPLQTTTLGTGTTQSTGQGKPVVSFDLAWGQPRPGNNQFVMELENAAPVAAAVLLIGFPAAGPFPMLGDGTFVLDPQLPVVASTPVVTDSKGDAAIPLPIPAGSFGVTLANQWVVIDPGGGLALSNALVYSL